MKSRLLIILCCAFPLIIISCSKKPRSVLSKEKMIAVLTDVEIATSLSDGYNILPAEYRNNEEYKQRIMEGVYKKHNITKAKLDSSLVWYSENLNEYNAINDSVLAHLRRVASTLREDQAFLETNKLKKKQNTLSSQSYLSYTHPLITLKFEKSEFDKLDKSLLDIRFGILGMNENDSIEAGFYFKYKDTTIVNNFYIFSDSLFRISKPQLADSLMNNISGYIRLRHSNDSINPILVYDFHYIDSTLYKAPVADSLKIEKSTEAALTLER